MAVLARVRGLFPEVPFYGVLSPVITGFWGVEDWVFY